MQISLRLTNGDIVEMATDPVDAAVRVVETMMVTREIGKPVDAMERNTLNAALSMLQRVFDGVDEVVGVKGEESEGA